MRISCLLITFTICYFNFSATFATQSETGSLSSIRATFMLHVVNYSRWHADKTQHKFCLFESAPEIYFNELLRDDLVKKADVAIELIKIENLAQAVDQQCHYLFIGSALESESLFEKLKQINQSMVTIGESMNFVDEGGLVGLVLEFDKVRIYINKGQYDNAPVSFSATLLQFANFTG